VRSKSSADHQCFVYILKKFTQSTFFNSLAYSSAVSAPHTPTKISSVNNSNISNSFLQFAFKFLIFSTKSSDHMHLCEQLENTIHENLGVTQEHTIQLFGIYLNDLVMNSSKLNEGSMLNALILTLTWCLTSETENIRSGAIKLLEKCQELSVSSNGEFKWSNYIKKIIKHKEEILIDGPAYVPSKCLNKVKFDFI
jgi:hypothetical protein